MYVCMAPGVDFSAGEHALQISREEAAKTSHLTSCFQILPTYTYIHTYIHTSDKLVYLYINMN